MDDSLVFGVSVHHRVLLPKGRGDWIAYPAGFEPTSYRLGERKIVRL